MRLKSVITRLQHIKLLVNLAGRKIYSKLPRKVRALLSRSLIRFKSLPWRVIGIALMAAILIGWLSVHFYFASPSRLTEKVGSNITSIQSLEQNIQKTADELQKHSLNNDLPATEASLGNLSADIGNNDFSMPWKPLFWYAYRGNDEISERLTVVYDLQSGINPDAMQRTAIDYREGIDSIRDFYELQPIEKDTDAYLRELVSITETVKSVDSENENIDYRILIRIYEYVYQEGLRYQAGGSLENFDAARNNLSSELLKEYAASFEAWRTSNQFASLRSLREQLQILENSID